MSLILQFKSILVTLVASSLVAAQSLPNLSGDCVSQCSALVNDLNSTCTDATDFASCYCGIYEKDLPGDVWTPVKFKLISVH